MATEEKKHEQKTHRKSPGIGHPEAWCVDCGAVLWTHDDVGRPCMEPATGKYWHGEEMV